MAAVKVLTAVLFMALGVAAGPFSTKGAKCDQSDLDLDEEVDKLLEAFPKVQYPKGRRGFSPAFAGFEVGDLNVTGLNKIKRYGPVVPYCQKGASMIQVDLVNMGDVEFTVPWRSCSGQEGKVILRAEFSRFTTHLRVDNEGSSGKYLPAGDENPTFPVNTYNVEFHLEGLGDFGRISSGVLSNLFPTLVLDVWNQGFFGTWREALQDAVQGKNEVL